MKHRTLTRPEDLRDPVDMATLEQALDMLGIEPGQEFVVAVAGSTRPERMARARTSDPRTSHEAARGVEDLRDRQRAVLRVLKHYGPLADHQLVERYRMRCVAWPDVPQQEPSSIRSRRSELTKFDPPLVRDTGAKRPTPRGGRPAIVWGLTQEGERVVG